MYTDCLKISVHFDLRLFSVAGIITLEYICLGMTVTIEQVSLISRLHLTAITADHWHWSGVWEYNGTT